MYPCSHSPECILSEEQASLYRTAGRGAGNAIADGRVFDLPLAQITWKFIRGHELDLEDFAEVEPDIMRTLRMIEFNSISGVSQLGLTFAVLLRSDSGLVQLCESGFDAKVTNDNSFP